MNTRRGMNVWTQPREVHATGNQVPSPADAGHDRLSLRRVGSVLARRLDQASTVVPGDGSAAQTLSRFAGPSGAETNRTTPAPPPAGDPAPPAREPFAVTTFLGSAFISTTAGRLAGCSCPANVGGAPCLQRLQVTRLGSHWAESSGPRQPLMLDCERC